MATRVSFLVVGGDPSPASLETGDKGSLYTGSVRLTSGGGQLARALLDTAGPQADEGPWALCVPS